MVAVMAKNWVYFDLETRRSAGDVGGWDKKHDMGVSVAVAYSTRTDAYSIYTEDTIDDLIKELRYADCVIGYNHVNFDYAVLMGFTPLVLPEITINLDLCADIESRIQHRPKLEAIAAASLGYGKTAEGIQAIKWWREGKLNEIARYCCYDVKATRLVHYFGIKNGFVKYEDVAGQIQTVEVDWTDFDA